MDNEWIVEMRLLKEELRLVSSCQKYEIPDYMVGALQRYVTHGISPGSFLRAVLENNFMDALGAADLDNATCLLGWANLVYSDLPYECKGSRIAVREWMKMGGLKGAMQAFVKPTRIVVDDEIVGANGRPTRENEDAT